MIERFYALREMLIAFRRRHRRHELERRARLPLSRQLQCGRQKPADTPPPHQRQGRCRPIDDMPARLRHYRRCAASAAELPRRHIDARRFRPIRPTGIFAYDEKISPIASRLRSVRRPRQKRRCRFQGCRRARAAGMRRALDGAGMPLTRMTLAAGAHLGIYSLRAPHCRRHDRGLISAARPAGDFATTFHARRAV